MTIQEVYTIFQLIDYLRFLRGVNDGELQVKEVSVEQDYCLNGIRRFVYPKGERIPFENKQQIEEAIEDSYKDFASFSRK